MHVSTHLKQLYYSTPTSSSASDSNKEPSQQTILAQQSEDVIATDEDNYYEVNPKQIRAKVGRSLTKDTEDEVSSMVLFINIEQVNLLTKIKVKLTF